MRATCPSCQAVYEIPDRLAGAGRRLRCAACGNEWTLTPPPLADAPADPLKPAPAPAPAEAPPQAPVGAKPEAMAGTPSPPAYAYAPSPEPPPAPAAQTRPMLRRAPQVIDPPLPQVDDSAGFRRRGDLALRAAWIGSVLLVLLALGALWTFRYEIATAWPPAARLVGTPVTGG